MSTGLLWPNVTRVSYKLHIFAWLLHLHSFHSTEGLPMKTAFNLTLATLAGVVSLSFAPLASAQEVTGAGASFPAPLYSKWAADYNKATGVRVNYQSVGSGAGIKQIEISKLFGVSPMTISRVVRREMWK